MKRRRRKIDSEMILAYQKARTIAKVIEDSMLTKILKSYKRAINLIINRPYFQELPPQGES